MAAWKTLWIRIAHLIGGLATHGEFKFRLHDRFTRQLLSRIHRSHEGNSRDQRRMSIDPRKQAPIGAPNEAEQMSAWHRGHPRPSTCVVAMLLWLGFSIVAPAATLLTNIFSFDGTNAALPDGTLTQGPDDSLYGTTLSGGSGPGRVGTLFRLTPGGQVVFIASFEGTNGAWPTTIKLLFETNGSIYGTTYKGGSEDLGTVFELRTNSQIISLASFTGTNGPTLGAHPEAGLVRGADGNLYGTTAAGGLYNLGTVFRISPGGAFSSLLSFDATNGAQPVAKLVLGEDGDFYGTTQTGGTNSSPQTLHSSFGTIFRITPAGNLTTLVSFDGTNGALPQGGLTPDSQDNFYGTTALPGGGRVFRFTHTGELQWVARLDGTNSDYPSGELLLGADGNFYGTTQRGGAARDGTVYEISPDGALKTLFEFNDTGGLGPLGGLTRAADGALYGTTRGGGSYRRGSLFRLSVPMPPKFLGFRQNAGAVTITWSSVIEQHYQLQSAANLRSTNWTDVGDPMLATNGDLTASEPLGPGPVRFYRVLVLP